MNISISIPEWHRMAEEGNAPPARIQLNGFSMNPLIRGYRDYVTVVHLEELPEVGDIVLFCERDTGRYVMHRVWEVNDGMVLTWGDNCSGPDTWLRPEDIWGKAVKIERGKHVITPDPIRGVRWAKFWHKAGKCYRLCRRYKNGIMRRIRKLKSGGTSEA